MSLTTLARQALKGACIDLMCNTTCIAMAVLIWYGQLRYCAVQGECSLPMGSGPSESNMPALRSLTAQHAPCTQAPHRPNGEKPIESRLALSLRLMKICVLPHNATMI